MLCSDKYKYYACLLHKLLVGAFFLRGNRMSFYDVKGYYGPSRFHMRSTRNELKLAISFIPTNPSNTQYMSTTIIIIIILKNISRKKKVNVLCITFSWEMACIYVWLGFKKISLIHITYNANFHRGFVECNIINGKIKVQNNLLLWQEL